MEALTEFLREQDGPTAYLLIGLASLLEYLIPPFPGDTLALLGVSLAVHAGKGVLGAFLSLTLFSTLGGWLVYEVGVVLGRRRNAWPAFLRTPLAERAFEKLDGLFRRHGSKAIAINRFAPAARAFFFLGAALSGVSRTAVIVYGALSAAAWNGLLVAAAYAVGANVEALTELYQQYTLVAVGIVLVIVVIWWMRSRRDLAQD